jgi:NAD(P)H-dependent flavin oxidoreductase YrpB (nitropropane dioxygenase family)
LLAIAVHLKQQGERVVLLGANTPTEALAVACKQVKASALCLSLIKKRSANEVRSLLTEIVDACKVPVVIAGGPTAREHLKAVYAAGAEFAETADELTLAIEKKRS